MQFFEEGVRETATDAVTTARRLVALFETDRARIKGIRGVAGSAFQVHDVLTQNPVASAKHLSATTKLSIPTVNSAVATLQRLGVVRETTGRKRNRVFAYSEYLRLLTEDGD